MSRKAKIMELQDCLSLDENDYSDFIKCFTYIQNYLKNLQRIDASINMNYEDLDALLDKFILFCQPIIIPNEGIDYQLKNAIAKYEVSMRLSKAEVSSERLKERTMHYQSIYSNFLKLYNRMDRHFRDLSTGSLNFNGFLNFNISNKKKAIVAIQEAIEIINQDQYISDKSKQKVISFLSDAIQELLNPKTNWKSFFIRISEISILLGAIGTVVQTTESGYNLLHAKDKVEEAKTIIINTSLNVNHANMNNTFVIEGNYEIENNRVKLLK
jgi:hypothetical protein